MQNDLMPLLNECARGGTAKPVGAASNQDPCHVRSISARVGASFVLLCSHVFQPVHRLAIELLLNRDVRHRRRRRCAMPVLLAWRNPDDVARPNLLDRPTPSLGATHAG